MTDIRQEVGTCERCWGKAFTAAYGIGSKTQAGEYKRIVATCACTQAQRLGVDDSFAEGYKAALAACALQEQRRVVEAKIAVLEEEDLHMVNFFEGTYNDENRMHRQNMIDRLRKEIE